MKIKSTKRAFIASVLSLLLCASMLIGTTFAWFTDSVESGINTIQSGNLDVELYYTDSADVAKDPDSDEWKKVDANTNVFGYNNWEPGFTKVVYFKVENEGSLALKYQLSADVDSEKAGINKDGKEFLLSDYIYTKVVGTDATRDAILASTDGVKIKGSIPMNNAGELEKGENSVIGFAIWMPTDVGNVANHNGTEEGTPQITFGINLIATQKMSENDSFGPDYDEDAWDNAMKVYSAADLSAALANGAEKIVLGADVVVANGFVINEDVAINLNGHTITATGDKATLFQVGDGVNEGKDCDADLTIFGGKIVLESTNGVLDGTNASTGASIAVDFMSTGTLNIYDTEIVGSRRGGARAVEIGTGEGYLKNVTIDCEYGTGVNAYWGSNVVLDDCNITVNGMYSAPYNSVCFSVMYGATMTINSGNYKLINNSTYNTGDTHGGWVGIVMNSGGTITTTGGTFTNVPAEGFKPQYERAIIEAENLDPATATVNLLGGLFIPQEDNVVSGYGDVNYPVVTGRLLDNGDGTWTAVPEEEGKNLSLVTGYPHLYTDGTNYYVYTAAGLISMRNFWADNQYGNNMWGKSYNVMADIDATGYTWNEVWVNVGSNDNNGFVFDGNGHTVTGLTINGALFSGTPNGGNKPDNPGYVQNITFDGVSVVGDHFAGVLWSNVYNELVVENVTVKNSTITGNCNVAALVGATVIDGSVDAKVTFKNCVVENNTIVANGKDGQDPNGASAFISRAYGNTTLVFEGNVAKNNEIVNKNGLVGGIYGYAVHTGSAWAGTGASDDFTNWNGITVAATGTTITDAINSGASEVVLPEGEYKMPASLNGGGVSLQGKTVTISGTKDTVIDATTISANDQFVTGATLEFDGVTLNFGTTNYMGFANTASLTYKNCTINGLQFLYGENVTFENCVFNSNGAEHSVWTYGVKNVSFVDCDFTYGDRCVNVYTESGLSTANVSFEKCTFATENTTSKGAVEINSGSFKQNVNVSFAGCTAPAYGTMVGISGWDSVNGANSTVTVDGTVITATQWEK